LNNSIDSCTKIHITPFAQAIMPQTTISRVSHNGAVTKAKSPGTKAHQPSQKAPPKILKKLSSILAGTDLELPITPTKTGKTAGSNSASKSKTTPRSKTGAIPTSPASEKRLRRHRANPPTSFQVKLQRAQTQRMIVLSRRRTSTPEAPSEEVDIVGSTGNIYTVTISHIPRCTCPDSRKGNECKHKVYALHTVLKAREELIYQLALLTNELEDIFAHAPPIPSDVADADAEHNGKRKPTNGECPICYMDLASNENELVWCKAQCGHNLHKSCFDQWAKSQRGQDVRCVYCRTPWQQDIGDVDALKKAGEQGEDGYFNVASQFGMSRARDYSGYYQPWARRQFGVGW
jgi:hypothetical protein